MKNVILCLLMAFAIFLGNIDTAEAQYPCPVGQNLGIKTTVIQGCPITVYYCWRGGAEPFFKIINIYVHAGCNFNFNNITLGLIYKYIISNETGFTFPPCDPENNVFYGIASITQNQCYRYEKRGYPYYEFNFIGGYSIVPCEVYAECFLEYSVCPNFSGTHTTYDINCISAYVQTETDSPTNACSIDTNNSILNQFIADPNMIESACISIECACP